MHPRKKGASHLSSLLRFSLSTSSFPFLIITFTSFIFLLQGVSASSLEEKSGGKTVECTLDGNEVTCDGETYSKEEKDNYGTFQFYRDIVASLLLVILAGLMSGLTMGLLSLDPMNLRILKESGTEEQKKYATGLAPLIQRHHLLLVTLLVGNAFAAEALPIFLDKLVGPYVAVAVSVSAVLLFGEIIPQAIMRQKGLAIGYYLRWFVWLAIIVLGVVAYPISTVLDCLIGHDKGTFYRRAELKELISIHASEDQGEQLSYDEVTIIKGALDMKAKTVSCCTTNIKDTFMLDVDSDIDFAVLKKLLEVGHSRVLVYQGTREHVVGMLLVKSLVLIDPNKSTPLKTLKIHRVPHVTSEMPLFDMLNLFQTGSSHIALVTNARDHLTPIGIVTLEDVLEELIQEEIFDETDVMIDVEKQINVASSFTKPQLTRALSGVRISRSVGNNISSPLRNSTPSDAPISRSYTPVAQVGSVQRNEITLEPVIVATVSTPAETDAETEPLLIR